MRWEGSRRSSNIEDRRGLGAGTIGGGGIGMLLIVLAVSCLTGTNPLTLLQMAEEVNPGQTQQQVPTGTPSDPAADQISAVLADTEDTWERVFQAGGKRYDAPVLVLFEDVVQSACGRASSATGPFYCPGDQKVYLDLSFFRELDRRFGAPGDFAQAYVIAHEIGHHVQNQLGIFDRAQRGQGGANSQSVMIELQADCLAGVWAHHADAKRHLLEPGDLEEGLGAASAVGDDTLQRRSGGTVRPESFTHGTSEQRKHWFRRGMKSGSVDSCDTFSGA
jgi:uncharacterized protein